MAIKTILLTTGSTWTIPTDMDVSVAATVICIGGGGGAAGGTVGTGGGGGGAFASSSLTFTAGATINISIGLGGVGTTSVGATGGNTWLNWNGTTSSASAPTSNATGVLAKGATLGTTITGGAGGATATSFGTTKFAGGNGGNSVTNGAGGGGGSAAKISANGGSGGAGGATGAGGGGGTGGNGVAGATQPGAGGLNYTSTAGSGGAAGTSGTTATSGSAGSAGAGGGGGGGTTSLGSAGSGGAGSAGSEYTLTIGGTAGSGGGAGGSGIATGGQSAAGANGGLYGGGGGGVGTGAAPTKKGGNGGNGAIIIQYTLTADTIPDAFTFVDQTGVALNSTITSASITVAGINTASAISVSAGSTYSINGGAYVSTTGTVTVGNTVTVRHTSSSSFSATTDTTLNIGGVTDIFTSTTLAIDTTPTQFTFVDQTNVALNSTIISAPITIAGINSPATISITGGSYSINSGTYTNVTDTVSVGDSVTVSHTSSSSNSATINTTLTIGGIFDTFSSTTIAAGATYNVIPASSSVNEGSSLVFNVTTSGVADTTLYWTISPASDVSTTSGSFALTASAGSFTLTAIADSLTEGLETFTVSVRTTSISGTVVATTVFSINDTSTGVAANNRVVLGLLGDGTTYGLEISKPGYNVLTASRENIIFSSKWGGAGNILMQGFGTATFAGGSLYGGATFTITYPNTLTYFPMVFACLTDSTNTTVYAYNSYNIFTFTGGGPAGGRDVVAPSVSVTAGLSSASIGILSLAPGQTMGVRYYVLAIPGGS